jgi:hypothetical protein
MPVILTAIFRVANWQALLRFSDQHLIIAARAAGATRYRIYRNVHNAAEALLLAELASHDAVAQVTSVIVQIHQGIAQLHTSPASASADDRVWEPSVGLAIEEEHA